MIIIEGRCVGIEVVHDIVILVIIIMVVVLELRVFMTSSYLFLQNSLSWNWACSRHRHIGYYNGRCFGIEGVHNIVILVFIKVIVLELRLFMTSSYCFS